LGQGPLRPLVDTNRPSQEPRSPAGATRSYIVCNPGPAARGDADESHVGVLDAAEEVSRVWVA
ncbi:MAG: hypothetical protein M3066_10655, partial [Actinomycetota bacterium]|nr:hypothetical protein [Actinomycetota bacterium]